MMKFSRTMILSLALTCLTLACHPAYAAGQASLTANTISYNSNTKEISAVGNVLLTRGQSRVRADNGEGSIEKSIFGLKGNVSGVFPEYSAELKSADSLRWTAAAGGSGDGLYEAQGGVHLTRGDNDFLKASYVRWEAGSDKYLARGEVDAHFEGRILNAAEASRSGDEFSALKMTRFEDTAQKAYMSAERVDGKMSGDQVEDAVATGNVKMNYRDNEGFVTNLTGDRAVYSREQDTVVVSGSAKAVRSDGKTVSAETMVLHVGSKNIEAEGHAKITFVLEDETGGKGVGKTK